VRSGLRSVKVVVPVAHAKFTPLGEQARVDRLPIHAAGAHHGAAHADRVSLRDEVLVPAELAPGDIERTTPVVVGESLVEAEDRVIVEARVSSRIPCLIRIEADLE